MIYTSLSSSWPKCSFITSAWCYITSANDANINTRIQQDTNTVYTRAPTCPFAKQKTNETYATKQIWQTRLLEAVSSKKLVYAASVQQKNLLYIDIKLPCQWLPKISIILIVNSLFVNAIKIESNSMAIQCVSMYFFDFLQIPMSFLWTKIRQTIHTWALRATKNENIANIKSNRMSVAQIWSKSSLSIYHKIWLIWDGQNFWKVD